MAIKQDKNCGTCRAWNVNGGSADRGECRKAPPTTQGWPKTLDRDWCIDGWLKSSKASVKTGKAVSEPLDTSSLAFNYRYLMDFPENACQWLSAVLVQREIPEQIIGMLNGGSLAETPAMLADDCDQILEWGNSIPGFCSNEDDDQKYTAIIIYTDVKSDYDKSLQAKSMITGTHPFMEILRTSVGRLAQAS